MVCGPKFAHTLIISLGPEEITVPDVTGMTYEAAVQILAAKGLLCSKATKYNDGTHTPDTVAETFPLVGTPIKAGDSISIILWSNPTPATEAPAETTQPEETTAPLTQPTDTYNQEPLG